MIAVQGVGLFVCCIAFMTLVFVLRSKALQHARLTLLMWTVGASLNIAPFLLHSPCELELLGSVVISFLSYAANLVLLCCFVFETKRPIKKHSVMSPSMRRRCSGISNYSRGDYCRGTLNISLLERRKLDLLLMQSSRCYLFCALCCMHFWQVPLRPRFS